MKFPVFASTVALALLGLSSAESINVGSVISDFYTSTPSINAAQSTSLASALWAIQSSWSGSPAYTSAYDAIISAAPSSLLASISKSGYGIQDISTQAWYTKSVPHAVQTAIAAEQSALDAAAAKIIGTPTSTSKGAGARATGLGVAGVVGVVGGVLAAL